MKQAIEQFCRYLAGERNVSPYTLAAYRSDLGQFLAFVAQEQGPAPAVSTVTHLLIRRYLALLHKDHQKSSIGRKLAAIRAFFKYLLREGLVAKNPAELVNTPKKEKRVPFHLNIDQVTALVEAPQSTDILGLRDRVIVETLYSCGIRVSELTGLTVGDLDMAGQMVRVLGKGGKERIVPVGSYARDALSAYLAARNNPAPGSPLLLNARGGRLTSRSDHRSDPRRLVGNAIHTEPLTGVRDTHDHRPATMKVDTDIL